MKVLDRTLELARAYLAGLDARGVGALTGYDDTLAALDEPLPDVGTDPVEVVEALASVLGPATTASAGRRYFGFVVGGSLPAALGADWLVSTWDQTVFNRASSPAGAAVEAVAERWVVEALGLPAGSAVGFVTGATAGNVVGLLAARNRLLARAGWDAEADGLFGAPPVRVVVGEEVHASLLLALRMVGFGTARAERVAADERGAMRPDALAAALEGARGPVLVCAQAGNVNTGACDPLREIVAIAKAHDAYVHVDGAFGLWAAASPARRHHVDGLDGADSWSVDAHKWLNVPYDSGLAIVRDPAAARSALGSAAGYLALDAGREPSELVPEMSRRARAVPVYAALRSLGRTGLAELVERCCAHAERLRAAMDELPGAEHVARTELNQVLLRFDGDDAVTRAVIAEVQREGTAWFGPTVWRGRAAARVSFSSWATTEGDVDALAGAIARALDVARSRG